ncbi:dynamin-related protein 4C-like protein [Tanacetum coccineum]
MEHIKPQESIILNVLSATVDFSTCESIGMSQRVDGTGQRTLAVVTKSDRSPDGLLEKVTTDEVGIGLGYVCVRNRINDETYDEARIQEANLFETHPLLSKIDKSLVGIDVLADKLVHIQTVIISKCLPKIVKKIQEKLNDLVLEYDKLPNNNVTSISQAMAAFFRVVVSLKEALQKSLVRGEFDEQDLENKQVSCNARLVEMLDKFSKELQTSVKFSENFLVEEIRILEETNSIRLPGSVGQPVFLYLLKIKVNSIAELPINFVNKVWAYLESVCFKILVDNCGKYPQLLPSLRKALLNLMTKMKNKFIERVVDLIESEKITDYTCDPQFMASWSSLMANNREQFATAMCIRSELINIVGYGRINVKHLFDVPSTIRDQAFDLKMKLTAYWTIVLKRIVDNYWSLYV